MDDAAVTEERRCSIEKTPIQIPPDADAFHRLPDEIIEQILLATDPDGFASLILLNSKWRATSQRPYLYAHHLTQCPSYATSHSNVPPADVDHLPLLRRLFAHEVKRNLFGAYLRPKQTLIRLVSNSISSSSCPGGEGMLFSSSPRGQHILAYNSSRIYVIDVRSPAVQVTRELKIQRRPVSACITDDASTLAVLSNEMQVDIYDLQKSPPRRKQSLILDNSPQTIAISSCGTVLAAAYHGGIEVSALSPSALPTEKRAVKCDAVDALAFSHDGTQILGTTVHSSPPSTVILTAPYYDPGSQMPEDNLSAMWTTSILFPNTSRDCSHAIWLPDGGHSELEWTFTYDRSFETFRAVRLDDLRNGTTYFTGPIPKAASQTKLLPCTLPATTNRGDLVSAGFQGKEIWIYGVPEDLDAVPEPPPPHQQHQPGSRDSPPNSSGLCRHNSTPSNLSRHTSTRGQDGEGERVPQWQILCDKLRNNLVAGFKVGEIDGISSVKWVGQFGKSPSEERLVVTATGVMSPRLVTEEEDIDFADGGRIALLDFDYSLVNGETTEITIDVGTDNAEPLAEERRDLEADVAIVRRRTVAQRQGGRNALLRAATTAAGRPPVPELPADHDDDNPLVPRSVGQHPVNRPAAPTGPQDGHEEFASIEEQEAMDAPYAHSSPRSQTTLRRAATAAAVNRRLNPRTADGRPIEYRRADGRAEHPHESDADNWVPPPPPYQKEDPGDLPAFLRGPHVAPPMSATNFPPTANGTSAGEALNDSLTLALEQSAQMSRNGTQYRRSHQRTASDSANVARLRMANIPRPRSTPSVHSVEADDIYDVSPQGSPSLLPAQPVRSNASHPQAITPPQTSSGNTSVTGPATNFSPTSPAAAPLSPGSSTGPGARPGAPMLELHIPTSPSVNLRSSAVDAEPPNRRLSNAQTWPRRPLPAADSTAPTTQQQQQLGGYPYTAPATNAPLNNLASAALPPAPSSNQIASLNKRISQGNPRRLSGNILNSRLWMDQGQSMTATDSAAQGSATESFSRRPSDIQVPDSDRPLIISTPTGVTGSYDPPSRRASNALTETPILAPVPRRPRPTLSGPGGTAQQLEDIYSHQPAPAALPAHMRSNANALPMWMRTPSNSSRRTPNGVNRRRSRAERSAAKNIKDAKLKGWKVKRNKKPADDSSGWVDVHTPSQPKANRCVLM
ncbi:hypothetical protein QQS21_001560 [Conoideocrella luteorostrata]|uniref:DUF7165 domain-containing protein n=1 Tax=Conoideocrella luteorostrata TaxID=1105319 RepID=A0AAJ0CWU5_9HYPO|nr:hypothetical protein QQS21_001560 [Conoideocrella luteorostrata]